MTDNVTGNKIPYNPTKLGEMQRGLRWRPKASVPPYMKVRQTDPEPPPPEPKAEETPDGTTWAKALGGEVQHGEKVDTEGHQETGGIYQEGEGGGDVRRRIRKEGNKERKPRVRKDKAPSKPSQDPA